MIGDFNCQHKSVADFKALYKTATMCAKQCFKNRVHFRMVVENEKGKEVLRVFVRHSEKRCKWIARVASTKFLGYNHDGLTLREEND